MEKIIQITSGKGPLECQWVVAKVLKIFLQEAKEKNIQAEVLHREEGDENLTLKSVTLLLKGTDLQDFLKNWLGSICWVGKSTFRKFHQRSNWFIGVFELSPSEKIAFRESDISFQMVRSQGSGGQNVNKVNSAVRATHQPSGVSVFVQDTRSQLENKKLAIVRIKEKLQLFELEKLKQQAQNQWNNHQQVARGNAVRTFHGTDFKRNFVDKSYKKERTKNKKIDLMNNC
ncbi:putative peptide chain release factor-like protein [Capnocytophaga canimorsus]|uniref:Putative peptide chain release factor-like protein n=1 Tax=Capnocytophaga canimorsus TaxID=28188 RepID=A0A0B7HP25_9FLAO|nr:peptide chain release factor H [Capnocytophaga canimorsus]CEN40399.1 putative peptide chain release factor-like protein [Capnocytophaga canimorsus]